MAVVPPIMRDHQNPGAAGQLMQKGSLASTRPCDRVDWEFVSCKVTFLPGFRRLQHSRIIHPCYGQEGQRVDRRVIEKALVESERPFTHSAMLRNFWRFNMAEIGLFEAMFSTRAL